MKYLIVFLALIYTSFLLGVDSKPIPKKLKVSVMDLKSENGIDKGVVTLLYELILTEFQGYSNLSVISKADISSMVQYETEKELAGCSETSCMAEIGGALGVDMVVLGHVGKLGSSYVVTLKLMNIKSATVENRVSETIPANEDKLIPLMKFLANKLFKKYSKFKIKKDDSKDSFSSTDKPKSKLYTWISLGTGTALLLGGGFYHYLAYDYKTNFEDNGGGGKTFEESNDEYKQKQLIGNVLLGVGGAFVITGTVLYFFEGEGGHKSKNLTISPFFTNDSFYVTTSFTF